MRALQSVILILAIARITEAIPQHGILIWDDSILITDAQINIIQALFSNSYLSAFVLKEKYSKGSFGQRYQELLTEYIARSKQPNTPAAIKYPLPLERLTETDGRISGNDYADAAYIWATNYLLFPAKNSAIIALNPKKQSIIDIYQRLPDQDIHLLIVKNNAPTKEQLPILPSFASAGKSFKLTAGIFLEKNSSMRYTYTMARYYNRWYIFHPRELDWYITNADSGYTQKNITALSKLTPAQLEVSTVRAHLIKDTINALHATDTSQSITVIGKGTASRFITVSDALEECASMKNQSTAAEILSQSMLYNCRFNSHDMDMSPGTGIPIVLFYEPVHEQQIEDALYTLMEQLTLLSITI